MQVHIDRGGERYGPYSIEDINAYLANGTLLPTDLAWQDGMTAFVLIHQIPGVVLPGAVATPSAAAPAETTCPQCQTPVEANQLICIGCGTNLNTGETVVIQTGPKPDNRKKFNIDIGQALAQRKYIILGVWCIATPILGAAFDRSIHATVAKEAPALATNATAPGTSNPSQHSWGAASDPAVSHP